MVNIAILASGNGTGAQKIIQYFNEFSERIVPVATKEGIVDVVTGGKAPFEDAKVVCVITNKEGAGVLEVARRHKVPRYITNQYVEMDRILTDHQVHYVILAGYLDKIPPNFCQKYQWRLINIHPALLQEQYNRQGEYMGGGKKYGGQGMYGIRVHEAVLKNQDRVSGFSIHFVTEDYDSGPIFFEKTVDVYPEDTPVTLMDKVVHEEHKFFPVIIEKMIRATYNQIFK